MGVYSHNRTSLGSSIDMSQIVADESYVGLAGASRMLLENVQNEQMMFDAVIENDFAEVGLALENANAEIYALQEATMGGLFNKIKEFLKKIVEKIKGLFHSFMARISGVITRDNKQLLKKYKAEVLKKNCKDMKYKWSKPTGKLDGADMSIDQITNLLNDKMTEIFRMKREDFDSDESAEYKKLRDKIDEGDTLEELLGNALPNKQTTCESGEFDKEYHDQMFEDEETIDDGLDSGRKSYIMNILDNSSKTIKTAKDFVKNTEKLSAKALKNVDNANKEIIKLIPKEKDNDKSKYYYKDIYLGDKTGFKPSPTSREQIGNTGTPVQLNRRLNLLSSYLSQVQTALTKTSAAYMREVQFEIKQARRVFVQAAAYRPKANKEDMDILFDAIEESVDYEVSSDFEMLTVQ